MTDRIPTATKYVSELTPHPENYNLHPKGQIAELAESLTTFGQFKNIVVWTCPQNMTTPEGHELHEGLTYILAGHGLWLAAMEAGIDELEVKDYSGLSYEMAIGLLLADNAAPLGSEPDSQRLAALLEHTRELTAERPGLAGMLERLRLKIGINGNGIQPPESPPLTDKAEELQAKWQVKPGNLFEFESKATPGRFHRLLCGDCRESANLMLLTNGQQVNGTFTSPPYWVGKTYEAQFTWQDIQEFITITAKRMTEITSNDGRIIINTGTCQAGRLFGGVTQMRLLLDDWQRELTLLGWPMRYVRFWGKRGGLPLIGPNMDVIDVHTEFLGYFYDPKRKPFSGQRRVGEGWATDGLWDDIPGERSANGTHEAAFPVELARRNLLLFSDPGDSWLDPFAGSGTVAVAAEREGRLAFMTEVLPKYCAVICERLEVSGLRPHRLSG